VVWLALPYQGLMFRQTTVPAIGFGDHLTMPEARASDTRTQRAMDKLCRDADVAADVVVPDSIRTQAAGLETQEGENRRTTITSLPRDARIAFLVLHGTRPPTERRRSNPVSHPCG
jgi:hypothetical protein